MEALIGSCEKIAEKFAIETQTEESSFLAFDPAIGTTDKDNAVTIGNST